MRFHAVVLLGAGLFAGSVLSGEGSGMEPNSTLGPVIKSAAVYATARDTGQRLAESTGLNFTNLPPLDEKQQYIFIDPAKRFQTILGIGGALTDAAAETFYKLPPDKQKEILRAYFDEENGIGYSLGRVQINSCDFSSSSYDYVTDHDP